MRDFPEYIHKKTMKIPIWQKWAKAAKKKLDKLMEKEQAA